MLSVSVFLCNFETVCHFYRSRNLILPSVPHFDATLNKKGLLFHQINCTLSSCLYRIWASGANFSCQAIQNLSSQSRHFLHTSGFCRFLMDQGAHFLTHQKPLTVMNVHNRARKHLSDSEREMWIDGIQKLNDREAKNSPSFKCFNRWIIASTHHFRLSACAHIQTQTEHHVLPLTTLL